jgi:hypothetical protein
MNGNINYNHRGKSEKEITKIKYDIGYDDEYSTQLEKDASNNLLDYIDICIKESDIEVNETVKDILKGMNDGKNNN